MTTMSNKTFWTYAVMVKPKWYMEFMNL